MFTNPFFEVPPLDNGSLAGLIIPQTGADYNWNPMAEFLNEPVETNAAAAAAASGAFYGMRTITDDADPAGDTGDIVLQGGSVSGWATPLDEILLFDQSAAAGVGAWTGTAGQVLQLKVTLDGTESSGIPNSGVTPTAAAITIVSSLGTNTYPTGSADMTGKFCHISLGAFFAGGFTPAGSGNINIGWCFSNAYTVSRE